MATITQASSYDVASDWKSTYANTAAVTSSTTASWGAGGAWSAGEMSFNWVNEPGYANGNSWQYMENYYNSNSVGHLTSGGTVEATYTYTVPWQTYQFNPGQTIVQAVGTTMTAQISYGGKTVSDTNGSDSNITLPSGVTNPNGSLSGTLTEIGAAKTNAANTSAAGFTTTAWSPTSGTFHDGHGSVQDSWSAVFYNYAATDETSSSLGSLNMASGSLHDVVNMANEFGPSYVAWTAPQGGYVSVNMAAYDLANASDGDAGFYVIASQGYSGNSYSSGVSYTSGPSTPLMASEDFAIV
ncbi:MAG TPA: hypothetical protein VMF30_08710, partial [Pirellulales bacterium]|nr:hypothetical protein [Pirellulales bacterium]